MAGAAVDQTGSFSTPSMVTASDTRVAVTCRRPSGEETVKFCAPPPPLMQRRSPDAKRQRACASGVHGQPELPL